MYILREGVIGESNCRYKGKKFRLVGWGGVDDIFFYLENWKREKMYIIMSFIENMRIKIDWMKWF